MKLVPATGLILILAACAPIQLETTQTINAQEQQEQSLLATSSKAIELSQEETYAITAKKATKQLDGKTLELYTYNAQFPGPELHVKQGTNATIVFKNELPESTTIHWHGIRVS